MKIFVEILVITLACLNLLLLRFAFFSLHQPTTLFRWAIKVFTGALTPALFMVGLLTTISGLLLDFLPATIIGSLSALLYVIHIIKITRAPDSSTGFENAFGKQWQNRISAERKSALLKKRYVFWLSSSPDPIFVQDIPFHTIENTDRRLLCDLWMPPFHIKRSGLAFIYLHGSAWAVLDKDFGTRTFFKHLASQGHVIMDVAYRLFPETSIMGMVHDAKHAVAWMKINAERYGVDPDRIIIGGGSAGAHIALLAAYTDRDEQFTPKDLENTDLSIHGVISCYGQSDLRATYYHTCQHLTTHSGLSQRSTDGKPTWIQKRMGKDFHRLGFDKNVEPGLLSPMLGGNPNQIPDVYAFFSPIIYIDKNCPPTLIIHGEHDILAPLRAIRTMNAQLIKEGVPVVMHTFPLTDHAFDLILPKISPSAHNAIYDVERFLALMAEPVHSEKINLQYERELEAAL